MTNGLLWLLVILGAFFLVSMTKRESVYSVERERQKCESYIELKLFNELVKEGKKPYTQVGCGNYRIDIALRQNGYKYAIECDGKAYHSSPEQIKHDRRKDRYLRKNNWKVMRLTGSQINGDLGQCLKKIERLINRNENK